ncbi:hypothetical protein PPERSA_00292 [Pseudocohnilembus persalinus]|uniref:Uncharacterized protein n=1 Tax=Pseudocohnilembus persalinus TaxID=266149 RepID=A0A0V0Q8Z9_PSEPJ|nr:hypothetical protein PPERSA_00292 [Pseudocohnilembus persalinus]|eukprot:KRW98704.1 hypothetical protein PPERSA_00292 [Pseudocohnilembus persalinus]
MAFSTVKQGRVSEDVVIKDPVVITFLNIVNNTQVLNNLCHFWDQPDVRKTFKTQNGKADDLLKKKNNFSLIMRHIMNLFTHSGFKYIPRDQAAACFCHNQLYKKRNQLIRYALMDLRILLKLEKGKPNNLSLGMLKGKPFILNEESELEDQEQQQNFEQYFDSIKKQEQEELYQQKLKQKNLQDRQKIEQKRLQNLQRIQQQY